MQRIAAILLFMLFLAHYELKAQQPVPQKKETPQLKRAATNLENSLIENDNTKIAHNYEVLAQEYIDKDEPKKAKEQLFKALEIYNTVKENIAIARVMRNIAQAQEQLNQIDAATQNYKKAGEKATSPPLKTLNFNDYKRLVNKGNTAVEAGYLTTNIALLKGLNKKGDVADAYMQLGRLLLKSKDSVAAISHYEDAINYAGSYPAKAIKIYSETATLYAASKRYEEAVAAEEKLLAIARNSNDIDTEITHLRSLAAVYFKTEDPENGLKALKQSYDLAAHNGKTFEARESLTLLGDYHKAAGNDTLSMALYEEFLKNLDRIILSDKSLTDAKTFRVTEERIRRLENEKGLKDELISRKNTFNYMLLGSVVLLLVSLGLIIKTLRSIKAKNKEIALQSLRREMNPHFLFNSLNSINQFIAQNNELEANKFLTSYSNLMRNTMENSNKDFVLLGKEVENLSQYLELEHLRFKDKFRFEINVDEKLDVESIWVPNMIIQPHLENAIWHGLRYKDEKGLLLLNFTLKDNNLIVTIDDNGIGIAKSNALKTHNQKAHTSRGLTNTKERMALLNELHHTKMSFSVDEKTPPESGTIVTITLPIIENP
jgi:two-component system, sensor histidine kinase YesM